MDFDPGHFCCWMQRQSLPTKCSTALRYLDIECIVACGQCLHLSVYRLYGTLCSGDTSVHRHSFDVLAILAQAKRSPSAQVHWLRISLLIGKPRRSAGSFPTFQQSCAVPSCRIPVDPLSSLSESFVLDHRISLCIVLHQCVRLKINLHATRI